MCDLKWLRFCLSTFWVFLAIACNNDRSETGADKPKNPPEQPSSAVEQDHPKARQDKEGWIRSEEVSPDGAVTLVKSEMPEAEKEERRRQYKQTELVQMPVHPRHNVTLFQIRNVDEFKNTLFIAPKLYAYGSGQKGRIAPLRNSDGTVSLSFPVVLMDGMQTSISSPDTESSILIPDTLLLKDPVGLEKEFPGKRLAPLPGCPKRITVKVNDQEYDATPMDLAMGDFCQMNTPFSAVLRVPEEVSRYILQKAVYASAVDVRASFETQVAFAVSRFRLEFDKSKIFEELEAEAKINGGFWTDIDAHAKVSDVVRKQAMKIHIQGDVSPHLDAVIASAISEFFVRFAPDRSLPMEKCSKAAVCLRLNYSHSSNQESFKVEWEQSSNSLTGQNYLTWTKLKPLQDKKVEVGGASREMLSNKGNPIETGLTVVPGDLLEIEPNYIEVEQREPRTQVSRSDNIVCIRRETRQVRCDNSVDKAGADLLSESRGEVDRGGDNCYTQQEYCAEFQNQWTKVYQYTQSQPITYRRIDQPVAQLQQLFDGLDLKFNWTNKEGIQASTVCRLNQFAREGDGASLVVRLENQPGCKIFDENQAGAPLLHIVNQINLPWQYRSGQDREYWDGRWDRGSAMTSYDPEVRFAGSVSIKGYDLGSSAFGWAKLKRN